MNIPTACHLLFHFWIEQVHIVGKEQYRTYKKGDDAQKEFTLDKL
jgi:hypothetical protein